ECPTVTYSPRYTPYFSFMPCRTLPSCTLECAPMRISCTSPRRTAFIQMLECSPSTTSPMTCADISTKQDAGTVGVFPLKERIIFGGWLLAGSGAHQVPLLAFGLCKPFLIFSFRTPATGPNAKMLSAGLRFRQLSQRLLVRRLRDSAFGDDGGYVL